MRFERKGAARAVLTLLPPLVLPALPPVGGRLPALAYGLLFSNSCQCELRLAYGARLVEVADCEAVEPFLLIFVFYSF